MMDSEGPKHNSFTLYVENINLKEAGTAPDGRIVDTFGNVYVLRNTDDGRSRNFAVSLSDHIAISYAAGLNTETAK